jgi:hypothetical protein
LALASGSAGFLSPFLDSDRITFCRVHGTGANAIEEEQSALEASNGREFGASGRDADSLITRVLFSSDLRASAAARWACPVGRRRRPETTARRRRGRRSRRTWRGASCQRLPPRRPASKRNRTRKLLSVLLPFLPEERRRRNPLWARTKRIQPKFTPNSGSSVITRKTHGWWLSRVHVRRAGRERERERERETHGVVCGGGHHASGLGRGGGDALLRVHVSATAGGLLVFCSLRYISAGSLGEGTCALFQGERFSPLLVPCPVKSQRLKSMWEGRSRSRGDGEYGFLYTAGFCLDTRLRFVNYNGVCLVTRGFYETGS